jgi:hypothetical protein
LLVRDPVGPALPAAPPVAGFAPPGAPAVPAADPVPSVDACDAWPVA